MTADGSPGARFKRALEVRSVFAAESALRETDWVSLWDAAEFIALVAEKDPERLQPYAVKWIARLCTECPGVTIAEVAAAAAALARLPAEDERAVALLHDLCRTRGARGMQGRHMRPRSRR